MITSNLFNAVSVHVKQHAAIDDATPQLKQAVERESRDVRLAPPLSAVLHVFLKLEPPARRRQTRHQGPYVSETLSQAEKLYPLALLPAAPSGDPDLAVSFHSASLPSFTQISSSSVNSSWATCSASSSVPRMNCTRWDGVSGEVGGCEGRKVR